MIQRSTKHCRLVAIMVLLAVTTPGMTAEQPAYDQDKATGLIMAPGWEVIRGNCTACHSARFITTQRGDRATWESMIRWMQKTQGLWQFPIEMETTILDYLATNYPPGKPSRRANLPVYLLPK
jgi:cytochrome c5